MFAYTLSSMNRSVLIAIGDEVVLNLRSSAILAEIETVVHFGKQSYFCL